MSLKPEFTRLLDWIPEGARVLDLGCGSEIGRAHV